jgi:subtilisin family serine protease
VTDSIAFKVSDGYVYSSVSTVTLELRTDPLYKYQWHLDNIRQTNFSSAGGFLGEDLNLDSVISAGTTGDTVTVAVIDSGLEIAHEDLAANIVSGKSWDYSDSDTDPTSHHNDGDHGTSVAGIIASVGWNKVGGRGVAPDASLVGYNFLHVQSISNEIHAMGLDNELAVGVDIFNMSYGRNSRRFFQLGGVNTLREAAFVNGVTTMRNHKGALYVKSAGNSWRSSGYCGPNSAFSDHLACTDSVLDPVFALPYVIGVGALNAKGLRSSYSTPGATIWVSGFGGEFGIGNPAIMSVDQSSCSSGYVKNGTYGGNAFDNQGYHSENSSCNYMSTMNGTSSAAPTVTGVIALMLEENPNLTWRDVKKILASTARQVDVPRTVSVNGIEQYSWITNAAGYKFHNWYGFGVVDAAAAVSSAKAYASNSLGTFVETGWNSSATVTATMVDSTTHYIDVPITDPSGSSGVIEFVRLRISLRHSKPNSLGIRLQAPSGTVSTLLQPYTRLKNNPNADCSATATCTYFELASNAFYGESIAGTWRLLVTDHISDSTQGIFEKYQINIYGH